MHLLFLPHFTSKDAGGEIVGKRRVRAPLLLARVLTKAYDDALQAVDLLVMPTLPMKATKIPSADAPREERVAWAREMGANTCPFDVTGHPAMTMPCERSSGLPVGMMLAGSRSLPL